jgi:voltage-gated potassium channel
LHEQPLRAIFVIFFILFIIFANGLKLSEGVLILYNQNINPTGFENYENCFWCIFITMGTIGYGDYFPKTLPGRAIIFVTAIAGVLLSSLLIVSLSAHL